MLWQQCCGRFSSAAKCPRNARANGNFPSTALVRSYGDSSFAPATYVMLYISAGMIVIPYVRDFYATQHIPSMGQIVLLQFFIRGPVFVLVCLLLLRMFRLSGLSGALAVGLSFTLLSGVATLIITNPFFPDSIRWFHFCEVTSSNFLFGCVVGWAWGRTQMVAHRVTALAN